MMNKAKQKINVFMRVLELLRSIIWTRASKRRYNFDENPFEQMI